MTTMTAQPNRSLAVSAGTDAVCARTAFVAAFGAVPPIILLHLGATSRMEPSGWTISDYVVSIPNGTALYAMTAGALGIGGALLSRALRTLSGTTVLRALLGIWAAAVLVTAMFPTNLRGTPDNTSSTIHLVAGAVVFAVLPLAGWMLSRSRQRIWGRTYLRRASLIAGVLSTALIMNRLPGVIGLPELMLPPGILQRTAGAALILLLAIAALALVRCGRGAEQ